MSREGSLETSTHRNNVRLVDHRLVKSQQGDVILECDGVERRVFYLPSIDTWNVAGLYSS